MRYPISAEFLNEIWIPNVFIYNLKAFQNVAVLKKLAGDGLKLNIKGLIFCEIFFLGVWIIGGTDVFYNQFTTVTFMCPMRWK